MKFTVNGFSQKKAVELGLSAEDLLILRWFVDFQGSDNMLKFSTDDGSYAWVDYKHFLDDMPIIKCNKKNLAVKFQHLTDAGVLKHKSIKQGGTFSAYCFGPAYGELIASYGVPTSGEGVPKSGNPIPKSGNPVGCKQETPLPENSPTKINLLNNPSTKNQLIESKEKAPAKPAQRSRKFIQPTLEEVKAYCSERGKGVDPEQWYDHYQSNGWMVGKTHMKDWKAAVRTWEHRNKDSTASASHTGTKGKWGGYLC
jgi:hypothetical protein